MNKRLAIALLLATLIPTAHASADRDNFPTKPLKVIVPFSPGGITDTVTRRVMSKLAERLGQPIVIENKTGANGIIGVDTVAKAPADGYSLVVVNPSFALNPSMRPSLPYAQEDLKPISVMARFPLILVASPGAGIETIDDLVTAAKKQPGITFASSGTGSLAHVSSEKFSQSINADMTHIPYRGSVPAITDVIGGQVTFILDAPSIVKPHVDAKKLQAIAVAGERRISTYPDVPTLLEAGYPDQQAYAWLALLVSSDTPTSIIERLSDELQAVLTDPEMVATLASFDLEVVNSDSSESADYIHREHETWKQVIDKASISVE